MSKSKFLTGRLELTLSLWVILLSGGCSDDKVIIGNDSGSEITFRVQEDIPASRAASSTAGQMNAFVVNGYAEGVPADERTVFDAVTVSRREGVANAFDYSPRRYYPDAATAVSFSAYSPVSQHIGTGFTNNPDNTITYTVPAPLPSGVGSQEDLLVTHTVTRKTGEQFPPAVALQFRHALSRIYVKAANYLAEPVSITGLGLHNLYTAGKLDIDKDTWQSPSNGTVDINEGYQTVDDISKYKILWQPSGARDGRYDYILSEAAGTVPARSFSPIMLVSKEQGMLVLPQTTLNSGDAATADDGDFYLSVGFKVNNYDDELHIPFSDLYGLGGGLTFEMGKQYALTLSFAENEGGPIRVRFQVEAESWEESAVQYLVSYYDPLTNSRYDEKVWKGQQYTLKTGPGDIPGFAADMPGYKWKGWNDGTSVLNGGSTITVTNDMIFMPNWLELSVRIRYMSQGGAPGSVLDSEAAAPGETLIATVDTLAGISPPNNVYFFEGWSENPDGSGTLVHPGTKIALTAEKILYAKWVTSPTIDNGKTTVSADRMSLDYAYNGNATNHLEGSDGTERLIYAARTGTYSMECWGAAGHGNGSGQVFGTIQRGLRGKGAYIAGTVSLKQGDALRTVVGGAGGGNSGSIKPGWNTTDRGITSAPYPVYTGNGSENDGLGGGATDIRLNGPTLWHRLIVAAGGGGGHLTSGDGDDGVDKDANTLAGRNGQYTGNTIPYRQNGNTKGAGNGYANVQLENRGFGTAGGGTWNESNSAAKCSNAVRGSGGGGWYGGAYKEIPVNSIHNSAGLMGSGGSSWLNTDALYSAWDDAVNKDKYEHKTTYKMSLTSRKTGAEAMPTPANASVSEPGHTRHGYARITYLGD